jgi:drug/metabolite transporter (DMT)-like permease
VSYSLALVAAAGSAICFGVAAVLEQIGARREKSAVDLDPILLVKLTHQLPYVSGILVGLLGWVMSLIAVRTLPLFLVQGIVASSIAVTVIVARCVLHIRLRPRDRQTILLIFLGLVLLAASASTQTAQPASYAFRVLLAASPFFIAILGILLMQHRNQDRAAVGLAILSGLGFSGTAICGRILIMPNSPISLFFDPIAWALVAYGFISMLLFTIAIQRSSITTINAVAFAVETLVPAAIGVMFLGDRPLPGRWGIMLLGMAIIVASTYQLAQGSGHILAQNEA